MWFVSQLKLDLDHPIPNGVDVRLEFIPQDDNFFLCAPAIDDHIFNIENFVVFAQAQTLQAPVYDTIERRCKTEDMNLPFKRKEVTTISLQAGTKSFTTDQLFAGRSATPARMIVGFVLEDAYLGQKKRNPYNFRTEFDGCKLLSLKTSLNGEDVDGLNHENCPALMYYKMQLQLGLTHGVSNGISMSDFFGGELAHAHVHRHQTRARPCCCRHSSSASSSHLLLFLFQDTGFTCLTLAHAALQVWPTFNRPSIRVTAA